MDHRDNSEMKMKSGMASYRRLAIMAALSFAAMYGLMYAMVDSVRNVLPNLNQFYMAVLMTSPMIIFELALMREMYPSKRVNMAVIGISALTLAAAFLGIRQQAGVGDREFLKSMIPHHASAILMCKQAQLSDARIQQLCGTIVSDQQAEIDQMKELLHQQR